MNCAETPESRLPAALPHDACFAIVAPAGPARLDAQKASQWFAERGYRCRIYPGAEQAQGYLAGADQQRLEDLHAAFADPSVDAILCMRGGYGSMRLLDKLDFELIRRHPKPLIGYSDITALHLALQRHAGFVTFHGPMLAQDLLAGKREPTESALFAMVTGQMGKGAWITPPMNSLPTELVPGVASGRLIGGNLALIGALIGTRNDIDTRDAILFIEDVNEAIPRVDRLLGQLAAAGKFDGVKGLLVGNFTRLGVQMDDAQAQGLLYPLILDQFRARGIPILAG